MKKPVYDIVCSSQKLTIKEIEERRLKGEILVSVLFTIKYYYYFKKKFLNLLIELQ